MSETRKLTYIIEERGDYSVGIPDGMHDVTVEFSEKEMPDWGDADVMEEFNREMVGLLHRYAGADARIYTGAEWEKRMRNIALDEFEDQLGEEEHYITELKEMGATPEQLAKAREKLEALRERFKEFCTATEWNRSRYGTRRDMQPMIGMLVHVDDPDVPEETFTGVVHESTTRTSVYIDDGDEIWAAWRGDVAPVLRAFDDEYYDLLVGVLSSEIGSFNEDGEEAQWLRDAISSELEAGHVLPTRQQTEWLVCGAPDGLEIEDPEEPEDYFPPPSYKIHWPHLSAVLERILT